MPEYVVRVWSDMKARVEAATAEEARDMVQLGTSTKWAGEHTEIEVFEVQKLTDGGERLVEVEVE